MKAKRQRHQSVCKAKVGLESLVGVKAVAEIAREHRVHPTQAKVTGELDGKPARFIKQLYIRPKYANAERIVIAPHRRINESGGCLGVTLTSIWHRTKTPPPVKSGPASGSVLARSGWG
jgi:hypothetical protein